MREKLFSHWSEFTQRPSFLGNLSSLVLFHIQAQLLGSHMPEMYRFLRCKHCLFWNKGPKRVRSESTLILWEQYDVSWPEDQNWHRPHTQSPQTEMIASHIIRYFFFYLVLFLHRCIWPDLGMCEEGSQFRESGKQNLGMTFSWSSASLERREDFSNCNTETPVNCGSPVNWLSGTQQKVNHNLIT